MRRVHAAFCGRRRKIATTYGCLRFPEATLSYSALWPREVPRHYPQTQNTSSLLCPRLETNLRAMTSSMGGSTTIASATMKPAPPPRADDTISRPDCRVCSDRKAGERHQTKYRCKGCKTPLCPYPCMERFHTLKNYKIKY